MTPTQAMRLEARIKKAGISLHATGLSFHALIRQFRTSGAWAITPEHHSSFIAWCRWFAPKIKMAPATLGGYGAPNYKSRYTRLQERAQRAGLTRIRSLNVSGLPARWMQKAIDRAHENGILESRRGGTERAIIHIAKSFLALGADKQKSTRAA